MKFATVIFAFSVAVASATQVVTKTPVKSKAINHKIIHAPRKGAQDIHVLEQNADDIKRRLFVSAKGVTAVKEATKKTEHGKSFYSSVIFSTFDRENENEVVEKIASSLGNDFSAKVHQLAIENGPVAENLIEDSPRVEVLED